MNELEKPILFKNVEELEEAVNLGLLCDDYYTFYYNRQKHFPVVAHITSKDSVFIRSCYKILDFLNHEELDILRNSVNWKDIKNQYKPNWYELEDSIGKPIWVRDHLNDKWDLTTFQGYDNKNMYPFIDSDMSNWKYAEPVLPEDCINLNTIKE